MSDKPRVRFAPSPTGYLHIGGARTALFNWLYARHNGGTFVLRIEDTDKERSTDENTAAILEGLRWLGLDWDEGPDAGGPHTPYFQSQRGDLYRGYIQRLLDEGKAYPCYCTAEELEAKKAAAQAEKRQYRYDRTCRDRTDRPDLPHTVRLKVPLTGTTGFDDLVYGRIEVANENLQDWIIARTDGSPIYNFVVVIDDIEMGINLVMRGEDGLNNTQPQLTLYQALGVTPPRFAHLPFILGQDRSKLSKRHGPVSVTKYRDEGFLPEAMVNFLARIGWSHGDQELFTRDELIEKFSVEAVGNTAGVFPADKLVWINHERIKSMAPSDLASRVAPFVASAELPELPREKLEEVCRLQQERAKTLVELVDISRYFFVRVQPEEKAAAKFLTGPSLDYLREAREAIASAAGLDEGNLGPAFTALAEKHAVGLGKIAQPLRVALTGGTASPGIYDVIGLLGREESLARIDAVLPA
ncbi:glutamate--tRNA ligase [Vulgatibacter incomptus]|uniref:Glutamate--tRNA ligase n=1 Tax=Vulgatibacter incomptus TaxID=1391653 RepID=A0A0K1PC85_9BACT|nr:glutamate--tRNA ligase [Vulgatibacter incomptus]AKU91122.1 Glutamyl-tRNA synthetase [Vulgatibacter incomptus]